MYRPVNFRHDKAIIIGGGESLKDFDFTRLNDFPGAIITVNRVIDYVPRSNYWITIDMAWNWQGQLNKNPRCHYFAGIPVEKLEKYRDIEVHKLLRVPYFAENKNEITGGNSAFAALNLAYHFKAKQVLMLGVDACNNGHWHPDNGELFNYCEKSQHAMKNMPALFKRAVEKFQAKSATVINGSLISMIDCFPKLQINDALHWIGVR